jgi:hypothetical protein
MTKPAPSSTAAHALDSSRQFATEAASKIGETARDVGDSVADLARLGAESVSQAAAAAERRAKTYSEAGRRYVAREPAKSALMAAAVGAAAAALIMLWVQANGRKDSGR